MSPPRSPRRAPAGAAACVLLALAGGCATVQRAREAQDPASAVPGERTPTAAELLLPTKGAVGVEAVVRAALAANPVVVQARHAAAAAEARVRETEAALQPQVSMDASADVHDAKGAGSSPSEHRFAQFGFDVSWLLFDFGRTRAFAREAGEQWLAAQQDLRDAEVSVAFDARNAYYELAKQIQLEGVAAETVRQFEAHLEQVQGFEKAGTRIPYDVTKAEVDLGNARLLEIVAKDAVLAAQATLANAVGLAEVLDVTPDPDAAAPPAPATFEAAWKAAQTGAPAPAAAAARERAASALVDARVAELYPSASLDLGASWAGSSTPLPWSVRLGPSVRWVPFDGFRNLSTIDEAVASLRGARAAWALACQRAWLDVRSAWLAMEDARRRVDQATLTVASARQNRELAQGRFEAGLGTSVELTDAERALVEARAARIQAQADVAIAASRLARATGVAVPPEGRAPGARRSP